MGKGDMKTRRGKLFGGSYGVLRPRKRKRTFSVVASTKKVAPPEAKAKAEKPKPQEPKVEAPLPKTEVTVVEQVETPPLEAAADSKPTVEEEVPTPSQEKKPAAKKPAAKKPVAKKPKAEE